MVWAVVTPRCLWVHPRGRSSAPPAHRQADRATLPDGIARRWRAHRLSSRPQPARRRAGRAPAAASERPVDVRQEAEAPPGPTDEPEPEAGLEEELREILNLYLEAARAGDRALQERFLDDASLMVVQKGMDLSAVADVLEQIDVDTKFPVPMKDYLSYPPWKQTFMGVERIRKCARFLISLGVEPKHVDKVLEGAALAASAAVASTSEDEPGSWASYERNVDAEIMRGMGVLEMDIFMDPAVRWLELRGFEDKAIVLLITECPAIVGSGVPYLQDGFNYLLHEILIPHDTICQMYLKAPWLLCIGRDLRMEPMVRFLVDEVGVEPEALPNTFDKCPSLLLRQVGEIACKVEFLVHVAKVPREDVSGLVISLPWLFEVDYCREMLPKMDFLVQMMGKSEAEVAGYPDFLGHHFPSRILPRHAFLVEKLGASGAAAVDLSAMLEPDDEEFAVECAGSTRLEFVQFRAEPKTLRLCGTLLRWYDSVGKTHLDEMMARAREDAAAGVGGAPPKPKEDPMPETSWPPPDELRHVEWEKARTAGVGPLDDVPSRPTVDDAPWLAPSMAGREPAAGGGAAGAGGAEGAAAEDEGDGGKPEHN